MMTNEIVEWDPAEEADALAVGPVRIDKTEPPRLVADLRFGEIADRKETFCELVLGQLTQEVGLVFSRIRGAQLHITSGLGVRPASSSARA